MKNALRFPGLSALIAALALLVSTRAFADKVSDPKPAVESETKLAPFRVQGEPINSFAFSLTAYYDKKVHKIARLVITHVEEGSDADSQGLEAGDEIVKINGIPVTDFDDRFGADSSLGKLLVNRPPGEETKFEVLTHRTIKVKLRAVSGRQPGL